MTLEKDFPATITAMRNCIGKTVTGIARVQYFFNDEEDEDDDEEEGGGEETDVSPAPEAGLRTSQGGIAEG